MITMKITTETMNEIIDCLNYAIDQMETSHIAVLSSLSSDDTEEHFDSYIYCMNKYKEGLEAIAAAKEGIIIVQD